MPRKAKKRKCLDSVEEGLPQKKVKVAAPSLISTGPKEEKVPEVQISLTLSDPNVKLSPQDKKRYNQLKAAGWTHDISPGMIAKPSETSMENLTQKEKSMIKKLELRGKMAGTSTENIIPSQLSKKARKKLRKLQNLEKNEKSIPDNTITPSSVSGKISKRAKRIKKKLKFLHTVEGKSLIETHVEQKLTKKAKNALKQLEGNVETPSNDLAIKNVRCKESVKQITSKTGQTLKRLKKQERLKVTNGVTQNTDKHLVKNKDNIQESTNDVIVLENSSDEDIQEMERQPRKTDKPTQQPKKKRYVLFVGQVARFLSEKDLQNHFESVGTIVSVRLSRAKCVAFVEVKDRFAYEKGLCLHHSLLGGRRINVEYTHNRQTFGGKAKVQRKNLKLQALRRAGKLHGSNPASGKRRARRAKQRNAMNNS